MFLDKVEISIKAGDGGSGHTSFHRDKLTMRGGPDGGDGGRGGNVVFVGTTRADNLIDFRFRKKFHAENGANGGKTNCSGRGGADMVVPVPLGTRIFNEAGSVLCDITKIDQIYVALKGGSGGQGNAKFATARRQTPNFSQSGIKTKEHKVTLELFCISDVGLVGFPNAGKSTLLSVVTRANPKIANYPFTTLHPNIGVANINQKNVIIADIPGLIEGAAEGVGLGHKFLKHIGRTRLLVHLVDASEQDGRDSVRDYAVINDELKRFSSELATKPQIVAINKTDAATPEQIEKFKEFANGIGLEVIELSAATHAGVAQLLLKIGKELEKTPPAEQIFTESQLETRVDKNAFEVSRSGGLFEVTGPLVDNLIRGVVLSDTESFAYFQRRLESSGVNAELLKRGVKDGDTVKFADFEFEFVE